MEQSSEIFTPPVSLGPGINPRENVLHHIRNLDDALEEERRWACTEHFMN